jgi:hypothetical protein
MAQEIGSKYFIAREHDIHLETMKDAFDEIPRLGCKCESEDRSQKPIGNELEIFYSLAQGLWHVWDALIVGIPILMVSFGDPGMCSRLVIAATTLISPLRYKGDVRPFLSIYDPQYDQYKSLQFSFSIVGVSSPVAFEQLIGGSSFGVMIHVGTGSSHDEEAQFLLQSKGWIRVCKSLQASLWVSDMVTSICSGTRDRVSSLAARFSAAVITGGSVDSDTRLTVPANMDSLNRKLELNSGENVVQKCNLIGQYFYTMTLQFLLPFLKYTVIDLKSLEKHIETPFCEKFHHRIFLNTIKTVGVGMIPNVYSFKYIQ